MRRPFSRSSSLDTIAPCTRASAISFARASEIAGDDVRIARMLPNPTLTASIGRAEPVFSGALAFRLPIFGQRGAQVAAAEGGVTQAAAEAALARWQLRRDARAIYYDAVRSDE